MSNSKSSPPKVHHYLRSFVAGLFGAIALILVSFSILLVWANRTLTDTPTYVATVRPLISEPHFESFVAGKVSTQILGSAPLPDLASALLGPSTASLPDSTLQSELTPVIQTAVIQIMSSSQMSKAWDYTNQSVHSSLMSQLQTNQPAVKLDFGPFVTALINEMKQTKLAPAATQMNIEPSSAVVTLQGTELEKIHQGYQFLKTVPFVVIFLTLVFAGLSIWISVNHQKTLRRMLIDVGVSSLLSAALIELPVFIKSPASNPAVSQVAVALVHTLLRGLQVSLLALGLLCIAIAVVSKIISQRQPHSGP